MIKTILIGLGKVGAIYDHKKKNSTCSHLDVLLKTDRYKVLQLVDKDPKKIELAKKKALNHPSIIIDTKLQKLNNVSLDLVIIASNTESHERNILDVIDYKPRLIICEKPLTYELSKDRNILYTLKKRKIDLLVNYHRRFDKRFVAIKSMLLKNSFNKIIYKYGKGFLNNASHMLDFFIITYGKVKKMKIISKKKYKDDFFIDILFVFKNDVKIFFLSFEDYDYDMFDMEFYSKNSKIEIFYGGNEIKFYNSKKNLIYDNYAHLGLIKRKIPPYGASMSEMYRLVSNYFLSNHKLVGCNSDDYFYLSSVMNKIIS